MKLNLTIPDTEEYTNIVDEETEKRISQSLKDIEENKYTEVATGDDLKNHLENLEKQV